jgi:hypothetical protein
LVPVPGTDPAGHLVQSDPGEVFALLVDADPARLAREPDRELVEGAAFQLGVGLLRPRYGVEVVQLTDEGQALVGVLVVDILADEVVPVVAHRDPREPLFEGLADTSGVEGRIIGVNHPVVQHDGLKDALLRLGGSDLGSERTVLGHVGASSVQ